MKEFLICYDITDPRRLNRIASCLTKSSLRIQKSIFIFKGSFKLFNEVLRQVLTKLDASKDDLRVYEITHRNSVHLGLSVLEEGILIDLYLPQWLKSVDRKKIKLL